MRSAVLIVGTLIPTCIGYHRIAAATTPLAGIVHVRAGEGGYALALRHDGAVLAWGGNAAGMLGNGTTDPNLLPAPVSGLGPGSGVVALAPSSVFGLALKSDGTVLGWGANALGQLGDGTFLNRLTPVTSPTLANVVAIAAGLSHGVALKADGSVWAWGSNNNSNLGNLSVVGASNVPVPVANLGAGSGVVALTAGANFTLALKSDGTVWGWGNNNNGQLGIGNTVAQPVPVAVKGSGGAGVLSDVVAVAAPPAAGGVFALARLADGTVWAWGNNASGQLGDGSIVTRMTPVQVKGIGGAGVLGAVVSVAAGGGANNLHALALQADGTVVAWGSNANGQLGTANNTPSTVPVVVTDLASGPAVTAVSAATGLSIALRSDGSVVAWGDNNSGQLGDGTYFGRPTPALVAGATEVQSMSAQILSNHSLAVRTDGRVLAWGNNDNGQLGTGNTSNQSLPFVVPGLFDVTAAAVGASHSLVLKSDGSVWAWGDNTNGQLGIGTTFDQFNPVQVRTSATTTLQGVTAITAAANISYALTFAGEVYAWGINTNGQLGTGTITNESFAVPVHGVGNVGFLGGMTAIAANGSAAYALRTDGAVFGWGLNAAGQVGDGTQIQRTTPVPVAGLGPGAGVVALTAIAGGGAVLKDDGSVLAWGLNGSGQVGDGTTTSRTAPVPVAAGSVIALGGGGGVGQGQTLAVGSHGMLLSWGTNGSGQLGDGTLAAHFVPKALGMGNVVKAVGGSLHSLALDSDGHLFAWGANGSGQLGDGTVYTKNLTPAPVMFDDVTRPAFLSVQVTPSIVGAAGQVTFAKTLTDADSGVAFVSASISGPSPSTTEVGKVTLTRGAGTAFNGEWSGTFTFPAETADGIFTIGGAAADVAGNDVTATHGTVLLDRTLPSASLAVSSTSLWPPSGRLVPVTISGTALDATSGVAAATYAVTDEYGIVQPSGALQPGPSGGFSITVWLEASRADEDRDGRQYLVAVRVEDRAGNVTSANALVIVPHNMK